MLSHTFQTSGRILALTLAFALLASGKGNLFTKVRYNGGSFDSKVSPHDWDNKLTVTPEAVVLDFHDKQKSHLTIPSNSIMSLSYGQEAHRRVGTMIALAILVAPVALFGLLHKTRLHFIGVQYKMEDGKTGGILLQGDKSNYRAILLALQGVSGAPVAVAEKEREYIPVGVKIEVAAESGKPAGTPPVITETASSAAPGTVVVTAMPSEAEIYVDGGLFGNGSATLKLKPGKHTILVKMTGYKEWTREVTAIAESEAHIQATLEKTSN